MSLTAVSLKPRIGARVACEKSDLTSGRHTDDIRRLLDDRGVLAFPQLNLTDEEQVALTKTLGVVVEIVGKQIFKVSLEEGQTMFADYLRGTWHWHIDGTPDLAEPPRATLLSARVVASEGGATLFANTYAAFEDLPESEQRALEKLNVYHSAAENLRRVYEHPTEEQLEKWGRLPPRLRPMVWTHKTGRKSLVLGSTAGSVEGMSPEEGRALIDRLMDWSTRPEYVYRHEWSVGDLVIWDNTGTMHRVEPYAADSGRLMHRTTLAPEEALV